MMPGNFLEIFAAAALLSCFGLVNQAFCQGTALQAEEAACEADALRLCGPEIPDHAKILACLQYYQADINPACRELVMVKGRERRE